MAKCHELTIKIKPAKTPLECPCFFASQLLPSCTISIHLFYASVPRRTCCTLGREMRGCSKEKHRAKSSFRQEIYENWQLAIWWNRRALMNFLSAGQSKVCPAFKESRVMRRSLTVRKQACDLCYVPDVGKQGICNS